MAELIWPCWGLHLVPVQSDSAQSAVSVGRMKGRLPKDTVKREANLGDAWLTSLKSWSKSSDVTYQQLGSVHDKQGPGAALHRPPSDSGLSSLAQNVTHGNSEEMEQAGKKGEARRRTNRKSIRNLNALLECHAWPRVAPRCAPRAPRCKPTHMPFP
ncbi:hypothetical protein VTK56DRAFT_9389 [Thermocarpiscus australiensis]